MESIAAVLSVIPPEPTIVALAVVVAVGYHFFDRRNQ